MDLDSKFPSLFYDVKMVEQKTPRPLPSMAQVMAAVMSSYGITNQALATDLADAATQLYAKEKAAAVAAATV